MLVLVFRRSNTARRVSQKRDATRPSPILKWLQSLPCMLHGSTLPGLAENGIHPPFAKKAWDGYFNIHLSTGPARLLPGCCSGTGHPLAGPCTVQGLENQHPPSIPQVPCSTLQESEAFSADSRASASPPPASWLIFPRGPCTGTVRVPPPSLTPSGKRHFSFCRTSSTSLFSSSHLRRVVTKMRCPRV